MRKFHPLASALVTLYMVCNISSCFCLPNQMDFLYVQTLRNIRDIDKSGVTEDNFHEVSGSLLCFKKLSNKSGEVIFDLALFKCLLPQVKAKPL